MIVTCLGDVVWPSLFVAYYYYASFAILLGFLVEWVVFHHWLGFAWKRAFFAALVANALSAALGVVLIPLSGLGWEFTIGLLMRRIGEIGTFNPVTWIASWLLAVLVNTLVEIVPLVWAFKVKWSWRLFTVVLLANFASVAFAFLMSLFMTPPQ